MILTKTPQKERLKSCNKFQKASNGKLKTLENICIASKVQMLEIQILLSDHSSDNFSDPCDVKKNLLVPDCTNEPAIGDYSMC